VNSINNKTSSAFTQMQQNFELANY